MRAAVAGVMQDLAAVRLGRGLLPIALLVLLAIGLATMGVVGLATALTLALGAVVSAGGMLLYGNAAVLKATPGSDGRRVGVQTLAGTLPYLFSFYVMVAYGLRPLTDAAGVRSKLLGGVFLVVSFWLLWHLSRLAQLHRLAKTMSVPGPGERG